MQWNGCWEVKVGRCICRWMIAWTGDNNNIDGCIAGYSGGGAFQLEKFQLLQSRISTSDEEGYGGQTLPRRMELQEDCQDFVLSFHQPENWEEADTLVLSDKWATKLKLEGDLLFGGVSIPKTLLPLFEKVGLLSLPRQ
jgi:hypothetical protein